MGVDKKNKKPLTKEERETELKEQKELLKTLAVDMKNPAQAMIMEIQTEEAAKVLSDMNEFYKKFTTRIRSKINEDISDQDRLTPTLSGGLTRKDLAKVAQHMSIFNSHIA